MAESSIRALRALGRRALPLAVLIALGTAGLSGCIVVPGYATPGPVYVAPRPVYVTPAPVYVWGGWGWHRQWR